MPAKSGKGTNWTPDLERNMLILAITVADLKPSMNTWNLVAQAMGNGITASAVSQKFSKLKRATDKETGKAASTTTPYPEIKQNGSEGEGGGGGGGGGRKRKESAMFKESNATSGSENKSKRSKTQQAGTDDVIGGVFEEYEHSDDAVREGQEG